RYPDVKLVYWCGGNPFHHHQNLARLREAFARPQTVVVHDPFWTATARHAEARDDYAIFGTLADRLQVGEAFTEGRTVGQWLPHLYEQWRSDLKAAGHEVPSFDDFWAGESLEIPVPDPGQVLLSAFRRDPGRFALSTPSGKIEIFSATIDSF